MVEKWGVPPSSIPDLLALVGDAADGYPGIQGWGMKSAAAILGRYGSIAAIPARASQWDVTIRGAPVLAARLVEQRTELDLYLTLARLRTDVDLPQRDPEELRWPGARRASYRALCDELGLDGLRDRPHVWQDA